MNFLFSWLFSSVSKQRRAKSVRKRKMTKGKKAVAETSAPETAEILAANGITTKPSRKKVRASATKRKAAAKKKAPAKAKAKTAAKKAKAPAKKRPVGRPAKSKTAKASSPAKRSSGR